MLSLEQGHTVQCADWYGRWGHCIFFHIRVVSLKNLFKPPTSLSLQFYCCPNVGGIKGFTVFTALFKIIRHPGFACRIQIFWRFMLRFSGNPVSSMETKSWKLQNDTLINMRFMQNLKKKHKSHIYQCIILKISILSFHLWNMIPWKVHHDAPKYLDSTSKTELLVYFEQVYKTNWLFAK